MGCLPGGGGAALHCWPWGPGGGLCGGCLWGGALYLPWVVSLEGEGLLSTADPGDREGVSVGAASGAGHHNTYHGLSPWRGRGCPPLLTLGTGRGSLWGLPLGRGIIIPTMGCLPGGEGAALHCWPWGPWGGLCGGCLWGGGHHTYHGLSPWRGRGCSPLLTLGTGRGSLWGLPLWWGIIILVMLGRGSIWLSAPSTSSSEITDIRNEAQARPVYN